MRSQILGTGHYVPEQVVTNDDLSKIMPTSDEWIFQRTGIKSRHYIDFQNDPMDGCEMGIRAAKQALEMANEAVENVDFLIWGTLSPDHQFPGNAAWAQPRLGLRAGVPCMDLRVQCSFLPYALTVADALIKTGQYRRILIVGSEIHSTGLDFTEAGRDVAVLFGDGAGALLLGAGTQGEGILATAVHADGQYAAELQTPLGSAHAPCWVTHEDIDRRDHIPRMNGKLVFKQAVTKMPECILGLLKKTGFTLDDLNLFISHQANLRIIELVQRTLGLPDDKIYNNIERYGNTTAASILIALDECVRSGRIQRGQLLCVASFGAGFTWGGALIRF